MTGETGGVSVYNANAQLGPVGGYPVAPTEEEPPPNYERGPRRVDDDDLPDIAELSADSARGAVWLLNRLPNIAFGAYHFACDPFSASNAYQLSEFPTSLERYLAWVFHLEEKTWMGRFDLMRMVGFWWTHKGEEEPDVSH